MVARAGGYYGAGFKGYQGVTQVYLLSPTIFNVVVGAVVRHWVTLMVDGAEEWGERGQEGRHQNALFYADDSIVASLGHNGSRVNLVPWLACSIGWDCGLMSGMQLAWYSAHARWWGPSQRRRTGEG